MDEVISIVLSNGGVATVSKSDWSRVQKINWSAKGNGYVRGCFGKRSGGNGKIVLLHRFIMSPPEGFVVDHIDGNPMNNCRDNLQVVTRFRNSMRSKTAKNGGVSFDRQKMKWRVRVRFEGRQLNIGFYATEDEARAAASEARRALWERPETNPSGAVF